MKIGFVHDWLVKIGGAEKVLEALHSLFPGPIYTLLKDVEALQGSFFEKKEIHTSFIQKLPGAKTKYRSYLPFFPLAIEQFDLSDCEVVISSSHCVAKGVLTLPEQLHICYCHTPMRYLWDLYFPYLQSAKLKRGVKGAFAKFFLHFLRMWDVSSAKRVDKYVANSRYVAHRIRKFYGREATVIHPPVDTSFFTLEPKKEDFYVTASRLVSYKKVDLIIETFRQLPSEKLVVIGDGPQMKEVKAKASPNIEILGYQNGEELKKYLQKAKAFVFAALEDFGILPVEAQACGTPVIAFGRGGVRETVEEGKTGIFFQSQEVDSLTRAIVSFEKKKEGFDPNYIRKNAEKFSISRFQEEIEQFVRQQYREFQEI